MGVKKAEAALVKHAEPSGVKNAEPALVKKAEPALVKNAQPAGVKNAEPTLVKNVEPAGVQNAVPMGPHSPAGRGGGPRCRGPQVYHGKPSPMGPVPKIYPDPGRPCDR